MITCTWPVRRYTASRWEENPDTIAVETTLKIYLNGEFIRSLLFLPENPELLVMGYLFNTGLISSLHDVETLTVDLEQNRALVMSSNLEKRPLDSTALRLTEPVFSPGTVLRFAAILSQNSLFQQTGAVHCGFLAHGESVLFTTQDTGRFNVLDKLTGFALKQNLATQGLVLTFSGRLTGEVISRIVRMKIPVVISPAAPTLRGLEIAAANNITVIGFARETRFNLYTCPERISGENNYSSCPHHLPSTQFNQLGK
ncbi:MAG: formate dehydrogenase accessory sulfurtransferase FdhD [Bacillota bacterium]